LFLRLSFKFQGTYVVVLSLHPLFQVVFLGLQLDNGLPELVGLGTELGGAHAGELEGLDAEAQGDLLLLLELFLGLAALNLGVAQVELSKVKRVRLRGMWLSNIVSRSGPSW
jgi:hypothetical protein